MKRWMRLAIALTLSVAATSGGSNAMTFTFESQLRISTFAVTSGTLSDGRWIIEDGHRLTTSADIYDFAVWLELRLSGAPPGTITATWYAIDPASATVMTNGFSVGTTYALKQICDVAANEIRYYIDGILKATIPVTISGTPSALASDFGHAKAAGSGANISYSFDFDDYAEYRDAGLLHSDDFSAANYERWTNNFGMAVSGGWLKAAYSGAVRSSPDAESWNHHHGLVGPPSAANNPYRNLFVADVDGSRNVRFHHRHLPDDAFTTADTGIDGDEVHVEREPNGTLIMTVTDANAITKYASTDAHGSGWNAL